MQKVRKTPTPLVVITAATFALGAPSPAATPAAAKPKITESGFTFTPAAEDDAFAGEVTAAVVVENPTRKIATDVEVTLTFKDRRGRTITDSQYTLEYIAPGDEGYAVWSTTYPETKVPVELAAKITGFGELMSPPAWAEDAQFSLGAGEFGADNPIPIDDVALEFADLRYHDSTVNTPESGLASSIIGTVRSTTGEELTGLDITCAAFDAGELIGGANGVLPIIPEGETAGIQITGLMGGLEPDDVRCSGRLQYLRARVGALDEELRVTDTGFTLTSIDEYTMGAVIENPSALWAWGIDYAFDVLDADGRVIGSRTGSTPLYIPPESSVFVTPNLAGYPDEYDGQPASLRVLSTAGVFLRSGKPIKQEAGFNPDTWKFEFAELALEDGHVTGTITSRAKKALNAVDISCGLFREGAIVGAATDAVDETELGGVLERGEARPFEVGVALDAAAPDEIRCVGTIGQLSDV